MAPAVPLLPAALPPLPAALPLAPPLPAFAAAPAVALPPLLEELPPLPPSLDEPQPQSVCTTSTAAVNARRFLCMVLAWQHK